MAFPLQTLTVTVVVLVSLLLGCAEKVSGMHYSFSDTTGIKHSGFPVNIAPDPSGIIPGQGRFLLPPKPPIAAPPFAVTPVVSAPIAAPPMPSCEIPGRLSPTPANEAPPSPSSGEDPVPPVPQP